MANENLEDTIKQQAAEPLSMTGDAGSATNRSLKELIEADRYLKNAAAARKGKGIRFQQITPPGAV